MEATTRSIRNHTTSDNNTVTLGISSFHQHSATATTTIATNKNSKMENAEDDDDEDDSSIMSISPAAVHFHPALPRPTRESVLQRLSEALLRRSLAKVRSTCYLLICLLSVSLVCD